MSLAVNAGWIQLETPAERFGSGYVCTLPGPHGRSLVLSLSHVRIYAGISGPRLRKLAYMSHVVWVKPAGPRGHGA